MTRRLLLLAELLLGEQHLGLEIDRAGLADRLLRGGEDLLLLLLLLG